MDALKPTIYHETQQPRSMMCGQHALNALLQGPYFTAADLSNIARALDVLEDDIDLESAGGASANVDETGFFSVQVLERALQVWNLSLINWRSADMRPFHSHPEQEFGFVLNLEQHWLTLRRFGPAPGYWYNLNSYYPEPTFLSRTYLGMFLHEAENEGYTVFAVRPLDPLQPSATPISEADQIAADLIAAHGSSNGSQAPSLNPPPQPSEEDAELEAAIRASLAEHQNNALSVSGLDDVLGIAASRNQPAPPLTRAAAPAIPHATRPLGPPQASTSRTASLSMPTDVSDAEFAEQLARSRDAGAQFWPETQPVSTSSASAAREKRRRETAGEEDEAEMIRRALAASVGEQDAGYLEDDPGYVDEDMDGEGEDEYDLGPYAPGARGERARAEAAVPVPERVLDDEDLELQAALRASLESAPLGGVTVPPPRAPAPAPVKSVPVAEPAPAAANQSRQTVVEVDEDEEDAEAETEATVVAEEEAPSLEEVRRARLARFAK